MLIAVRVVGRTTSRLVMGTVVALSVSGRGYAQTIPIVTGTERLEWDQPAADLTELETLQYALYVDDTRVELAGASCEGSATSAVFACDAALPPLSAGQHALQLTAFAAGRPDLESPRSSALLVKVVPATSPAPSVTVVTADGVALQLETVVGVDDPVNSLSTTPDGVLLIAQRGGALTIRRNGVLIRDASALPDIVEESGGLLAVAPDPDFARTHFVYVAYTSRSGDSGTVVRLARLREVSGTFGDRIVIFETALPNPIRSAGLRFAADGTLYFGVNDTIVRLNPDGTTPAGQAGMTPTFATGFASVSSFDWQPASASLWAADALATGGGRLTRVATNTTTNTDPAVVNLSARPSAMMFYRSDVIAPFQGSAFVASDDGQVLLRIVFAANDPGVALTVERLLTQQIGGIRAVAVGADGLLYLGTAQSVVRLVIRSK